MTIWCKYNTLHKPACTTRVIIARVAGLCQKCFKPNACLKSNINRFRQKYCSGNPSRCQQFQKSKVHMKASKVPHNKHGIVGRTVFYRFVLYNSCDIVVYMQVYILVCRLAFYNNYYCAAHTQKPVLNAGYNHICL